MKKIKTSKMFSLQNIDYLKKQAPFLISLLLGDIIINGIKHTFNGGGNKINSSQPPFSSKAVIYFEINKY